MAFMAFSNSSRALSERRSPALLFLLIGAFEPTTRHAGVGRIAFWPSALDEPQGTDRHPRSPREQPPGRGLRDPQEPPRRHHGPLGLGQEQPGLRHALR